MIGLNKEPRLRFTDEERADPALEKPIRKTEKATARADKAQANIPKKKVRQTVIDPDTGKKTSKLTFEDKKKPPSKLSQGVKEAPVHLVAGKFHKEIRETEQDNVGVESAHKSEEAVETSACIMVLWSIRSNGTTLCWLSVSGCSVVPVSWTVGRTRI